MKMCLYNESNASSKACVNKEGIQHFCQTSVANILLTILELDKFIQNMLSLTIISQLQTPNILKMLLRTSDAVYPLSVHQGVWSVL